MCNTKKGSAALLRQEISELGITQRQFAAEAKVSERAVRWWIDETSKRPTPGYAWAVIDLLKKVKLLEQKLSEIEMTAKKR